MDIFYLIVINIIPIVMTATSFYLKRLSKGNFRKYTGFRTGTSIKSKANWKFANEYAGKIFLKNGIRLLVINFVLIITIINKYFKNVDLIVLLLTFIQIGIMIYMSIKVESNLQKYDKENID